MDHIVFNIFPKKISNFVPKISHIQDTKQTLAHDRHTYGALMVNSTSCTGGNELCCIISACIPTKNIWSPFDEFSPVYVLVRMCVLGVLERCGDEVCLVLQPRVRSLTLAWKVAVFSSCILYSDMMSGFYTYIWAKSWDILLHILQHTTKYAELTFVCNSLRDGASVLCCVARALVWMGITTTKRFVTIAV